MDSRKIGLTFLMGTMAMCLVAVTQCQRSGDVRRTAPESVPPWTLTLAAPIEHLDVVAREPMIVEHPDGTLFVGGYGAAFMSGKKSDEATLWKSRDGGTTWERVNVGTEADGMAGNSDVDLAVAREVRIVSAYFLPTRRLRRDLMRVARRGGRVQLPDVP